MRFAYWICRVNDHSVGFHYDLASLFGGIGVWSLLAYRRIVIEQPFNPTYGLSLICGKNSATPCVRFREISRANSPFFLEIKVNLC